MQCVGHSTLHDTASTCSIEEPSYSATVYRHTSFRVSGHTVSLRCRVFEGVQRPVHCKSWMLAGFVSAEKTRSRCASVRVSSSISYARRAWHSFNFPCQVRQRGEKGGMNRQQRQEDGSRTAWDTLLLHTMGPVGSYVKSQEICARGESNASFPGTRSRCAAAHGLHSFMSYMYIFAYTYIYIFQSIICTSYYMHTVVSPNFFTTGWVGPVPRKATVSFHFGMSESRQYFEKHFGCALEPRPEMLAVLINATSIWGEALWSRENLASRMHFGLGFWWSL